MTAEELAQLSGALPDLRMALAALCGDDEWGQTWSRVAQHRFRSAGELHDHAVGSALTAKVTGAKPREYFEETDPAAREVPKVDFGRTPPAVVSLPDLKDRNAHEREAIRLAVGNARAKAETAAAEMTKDLTAGLPIPPGMKLPF